MEDDNSSGTTAVTRPRLYGIVHTYMQKHLPRDIHPAFKALRDREEASIVPPQLHPVEHATWPALTTQAQISRIDQVSEDKADDGDDDDDSRDDKIPL